VAGRALKGRERGGRERERERERRRGREGSMRRIIGIRRKSRRDEAAG